MMNQTITAERVAVRILAGPCPLCKSNALTLYSDFTWECEHMTVAENAVTGERGRCACTATGSWSWVDGKAALIKHVSLAGILKPRP